MTCERPSHRVPDNSHAVAANCIDDLDDMIAHGFGRVVLPFGRFFREPVPLEVNGNRAKTCIGERGDGLVENPRTACPAGNEKYDRRILISRLDYTDAKS